MCDASVECVKPDSCEKKPKALIINGTKAMHGSKTFLTVPPPSN